MDTGRESEPAVSLLIHADLRSAHALVDNLLRAIDPCLLAVHVSQTAEFTVARAARELEPLSSAVLVNPVQRSLTWGRNIVDGHHENLSLLSKLALAADTPVIFQASNDWYLRSLDRTTSLEPRYQRRPVHHRSANVWARTPDSLAAITKWSSHLRLPAIMSQIEGAVYPLTWALSCLNEANAVLGEAYFTFPAEEVILPTAAQAIDTYGGTPFVFSEVTRSEVELIKYWNVVGAFVPSTLRAGALRILRRQVYRFTKWELTESDIDQIHAGGIAPVDQWVKEGDATWETYRANSAHAVKRVPIGSPHPLRAHCESLSLGG